MTEFMDSCARTGTAEKNMAAKRIKVLRFMDNMNAKDYFFIFSRHIRLISSSFMPLVSGTIRHTKTAAMMQIMP